MMKCNIMSSNLEVVLIVGPSWWWGHRGDLVGTMALIFMRSGCATKLPHFTFSESSLDGGN